MANHINKCSFVLVLAIISGLSACPASAVYRFDMPKELIGRTFETETRLKKDGSLIGRSTAKAELRSYKSRQFLVITGRSDGSIDGKKFTSDISRNFVIDDGKITADSIKGSTKTSGKPWTDSYIGFDWKNMTARVTYKDFEKNDSIDKSVVLDIKMVAIQDLDLYLSSMMARNIREEKLKTLLPNGQTFWFLIKMSDLPETLTVKGQNIVCRHIELKPDLGLLNIIIPNVNYWVRNETPYDLIRYSGLLSGPGSPDVVIETVKAAE